MTWLTSSLAFTWANHKENAFCFSKYFLWFATQIGWMAGKGLYVTIVS